MTENLDRDLDTSELFFREIEEKLCLTIPLFIKNILKINGFTNIYSFKNFTNDDIDSLENFVRTDLPELIEKSQYKDYFGDIFEKRPNKFTFLLGFRKMLLAISEYINENMIKQKYIENSNIRTKISNSKQTKLINLQSSSQSTSQSGSPPLRTAINLSDENKNITLLIKRWLKEIFQKPNVKYLTEEEKGNILEAMGHLNYNCTYEGDSESDSLCCKISCYFCHRSIKAKKISQKNGKYKWILSNFYNHFLKHLDKKDKLKNVNTNTEHSEQNSILNYWQIRQIAHPIPSTSTSGNIQNKESNQRELREEINTKPKPSRESESHESSSQRSVSSELQKTNELSIINKSRKSLKRNIRVIDSDTDSSFENNDIAKITYGNDNQYSEQDFWSSRLEMRGDRSAENKYPSSCIESKTGSKEKSNKWSSEKYSRQARVKRSRERNSSNQLLLTNFLEPIDEIKKLFLENDRLRSMLLHNIEFRSDNMPDKNSLNLNINDEKLSNFLTCLVNTTNLNSKNKSSKGNKYETDFKKFCSYLFITGGRLLYETLYANMKNALPSISTVIRTMDNNQINGESLRFEELNDFLDSRNLPKYIWVSEDATKITGRIQYNSHNNQIVGFVSKLDNGLPRKNSFPANSAGQIQEYFLNEKKANYAYVIMAQCPINNSPSFCLSVFGTDNCFCFKDVLNRWTEIKNEAKKYGIILLGFSSDGDTRLLKAMRQCSLLQKHNVKSKIWTWFEMDLEDGDICVQDTVHIGTKMRTRLLKPNIILPMGDFMVSHAHLKFLIENVSKDKHLLTINDINLEDKMNFKAVEKMCSVSVSELLAFHVPGSNATIVYLKIIRNVLNSYLDKSITISQRISLIWYSVFCLRIWREWLRIIKKLSTTSNFITLNAYLCIEINAHSLIKLIRKYRDNPNLQSNTEFTTWLFSSQPCEQIFRATRSLTSTFSTVVNFSLQDIISRLNKIETIHQITSDLSEKFVFPREKSSKLGTSAQIQNNIFPNDIEIEKLCMNALKEATEDCKNLGIKTDDLNWQSISIADYSTKEDEVEVEEDTTAEDIVDTEENNDLALHHLDIEFESYSTSNDDIPQEVIDNDTLLNFDDNLWVKDLHKDDIDEKSPFVKVKIQDKNIITIRKTSLCWLLSERYNRVSTDRLQRFYDKTTCSNQSSVDSPIVLINNESYYAVFYSDNWYIGRILKILEDNKYEIKFMQSNLDLFIWPKTSDIQIVDKEFIFYGPINMLDNYPLKLSKQDRTSIVSKYKIMKRTY